jgi:hypothetical protein
MKNAIFVLSVLILSACASAPRHAPVVAANNDAGDELECVGKCLEFGDETCESCVDRCMEPTAPSAAIAATPGSAPR